MLRHTIHIPPSRITVEQEVGTALSARGRSKESIHPKLLHQHYTSLSSLAAAIRLRLAQLALAAVTCSIGLDYPQLE